MLRLLAKGLGNLARNYSNSSFRCSVTPYSGGSDHNIWGDPSVGVTCPMLIQWPDRYYHTSEDTIDKVDPEMLAVAGILTATYLYTAATATAADAAYVAGQAAAGFAGEANVVLSLHRPGEERGRGRGQEEVKVLAKTRRTIEKLAFLSERNGPISSA